MQLVGVCFLFCIAPSVYRSAYIKGEHLCGGYIASLDIIRNPKPEFNPPFFI